MQSLHPRRGSIQEYLQELSDPSRYRPDHCPLCQGRTALRAHGFYCRTLVDVNYDGAIRVRRYLCLLCKVRDFDTLIWPTNDHLNWPT
jgi:hypothetical protein